MWYLYLCRLKPSCNCSGDKYVAYISDSLVLKSSMSIGKVDKYHKMPYNQVAIISFDPIDELVAEYQSGKQILSNQNFLPPHKYVAEHGPIGTIQIRKLSIGRVVQIIKVSANNPPQVSNGNFGITFL